MKTRVLLAAAVMLVSVIFTASSLLAQGYVKAELTGYQEVPPVSTPAGGRFVGKIDKKTGAVEWELSYAGLDSGVMEAHIHFGQPGVNGGLILFLCAELQNGTVSIPSCPETEGTVTGVIDRDSIIGPADQGIGEGELGEALRAIFSGVTYVNVHTRAYPEGEIRGQIRRGFARKHGRGPFSDAGDIDDSNPEQTDSETNRNGSRDTEDD
jgi:hypothetical protein